MQNRILVARRAATCRLGSWRPTGEVPLHLGRAMMMMHTSWSLASDTPLKTPVHISLSLKSPRLKHLKPKSFFFLQQSFILRRLAFSFAFQVSTFLSLLNPNQKKYRNTLLFFLLASDLYPMSRNKTLHSSSCTLLSFSLPPPLFSSSGNHQKVLLIYSPSKVFQTRIYRLRDSIERVLQNKQREQETKSPRQFGLTSCQCCSYLSGFGERSLERRKRMKKKRKERIYSHFQFPEVSASTY